MRRSPIYREDTMEKQMIVKATTRPLTAVQIDGREIAIGSNGSTTLTDHGLAREVDARFGRKGEVVAGEVVVCPVHSSDRRPSFTVPALPWKDKKDAKAPQDSSVEAARESTAPEK